MTTEEVVEAVDTSESDDVIGDAAASTEEVEELASASDATADVDEECDTTDSGTDDEENEHSGYRCKDCGFMWNLLKPEDHEHCEGNEELCGHCGEIVRTIREVIRHLSAHNSR